MSRPSGLEAAQDSPIAMVCEKRHHLGEDDISYPCVFCQVCGFRIQSVHDGNAYWMPNWESSDQFYATRWAIAFAHKGCNFAVARASCYMELNDFVVHLAENLGAGKRTPAGFKITKVFKPKS
jgi:hypothetical protein